MGKLLNKKVTTALGALLMSGPAQYFLHKLLYHNLDNLDPFTKNLVNSVHVLESKLYSSLPNKIIKLLPKIISTGYVSGAVKHALYMQKNAHLLGDSTPINSLAV